MQAPLEDDAHCLLVIIGATADGKKELVGLADGIRESAQSWKELLLDLKRRGLTIDPQLAVADGALGFWTAIDQVWPKTRAQRCWVHKTANVLNKLPNSLQAKAKRALQDIWMAETGKAAETALDAFIETYGIKYEKAVECHIRFPFLGGFGTDDDQSKYIVDEIIKRAIIAEFVWPSGCRQRRFNQSEPPARGQD